MNPDQDTTTPQPNQRNGWKEPILALISSRIALIQHELKSAAKERARSIAALLAAVMCAFFTWALLLTGAIAAVAEASGWPWHFVTLSCAAIHLVMAIALFKAAKTPKSPPFPITRSEFEKDREWIENLQNKPK